MRSYISAPPPTAVERRDERPPAPHSAPPPAPHSAPHSARSLVTSPPAASPPDGRPLIARPLTARPLTARPLTARLLTALLLTALAALAAAPEARALNREDRSPVSRADAGTTATTAAYLAKKLRENPVHVSDLFPRTNPVSSAPRFAEQAKRTGVPTYVLVVPYRDLGSADGEVLLAAVRDRLREKGLYVLLDGTGGTPTVSVSGVDVPARDAATATQFELPFDAGTLDTFTHFVDVLRSGKAAERARQGLDRSGGSRPDDMYTSNEAREGQSFRTGLLLTGVPLLVLGVGWYLRRRRGKGPGPALLVPVAAGTAVLIGVGALFAHGDTRTDNDPLPTAADMSARTARVAAGLRDRPLYIDPLSPAALTSRQRAALEAHAARLDVPVRIAVVPLTTADESGGRGDRLAHLLHERLGEDGVYVVADARPGGGMEVVNHGGRTSSARLYRSTSELRYGSGAARAEDDKERGKALHGTLDTVLTLVEKAPLARPDGPYMTPPPVDDPVEEDKLAPLYSAEMVGGGVLGALGAAAAVGLLAAGLGIARRTGLTRGAARARAGAVVHTATMGPFSSTPEAPARPSNGWLRRTARRELDELNEEFTRTSETVSDQVRGRAWECLDAATLLLDQEGDNRVDADADAPTLAAGLALLRAGSATLRDRTWAFPVELRLCVLNPLHGQAASNQKLKFPGEDARPRARPVCAECAAALTAPASDRARTKREVVLARVLHLRAPSDGRAGAYQRYDRLPGPLGASGAAARGTGLTADQLVRRVREQLGVH